MNGRLAIPGFIDNHTHFVLGGFQLARVQLRGATSREEFASRIAAQASALGNGKWVTGWGWDEQSWQPCVLPDRALLDAAAPDNPVFVSRLDAHMAVANSRALRLAGITRETPDPPGGTVVRDAGGEPTGLLKDTAMAAVNAVIPPPSLQERIAAARAAFAEAARLGVTSLCHMSLAGLEMFDDFRAYQQLEREDALTARIYLFAPVSAYERLVAAGVEKRFGSAKLCIGGVKGFADGSLGSATAAFYEPYADDPSNAGLTMEEMTSGAMARWVAGADEANLQLAIHAIGDRANADVLALFESRPDCANRRFRIEHAQHLNPELIQRFAASRVIAAMQPYHAIDDGRWAEKKIGAGRARWTYPVRSLLDAGAVVTFGSDWSVAPLDPILGIYAAVTRRTLDGKHPDGWIPEEKITVEEALRCYTANNAWAMFAEHEVGRIAPGMLADIVVLSEDLFAIAPERIEEVRVDVTIFDGKVIYER
ncbi:MAG TPA: amidohydrolase [Thermoanaerobaculia bacterium]|nr:amidohydrolase [Thermoanaerobaculia bacterium]